MKAIIDSTILDAISSYETKEIPATKIKSSTMKALVYDSPQKISLKDIPIPVLEKTTDALVKVLHTTICGTDLGILHGKLPAVLAGTVLGHEGVGIVEAVGAGVRNFKKGDHVLISCITSDGTCEYCKKQLYAHCADGGWILGNTINGTQAEYVRIPHADNSLHHVPAGSDEEALVMLSDIFPTGHEIGVLNGTVKPGDTVAIIGAGPVGMAALITAQFYSPAKIYVIDIDNNRLNAAKKFGATEGINPETQDVLKRIKTDTADGVDVAIEAIGIAAGFDICQNIIRPGGHIAVVGVHGQSVDFQLQKLWSRNITLTTGLVSTNTTPILLKSVSSGKLNPKRLITHHFTLENILEAYRVFGDAGKENALKVIITPKH
jgi:alcohol dehydrogenase